MMYVCFCKNDTMSQCVANGLSEQNQCHFFDRSASSDRCMHLNQAMNSHCWSNKAQDNGLCLPDDPRAAVEEVFTEDEIDEMLVGSNVKVRDCHKCLQFACSYIIRTNAITPGGLTNNDFKVIATACDKFEYDIPY